MAENANKDLRKEHETNRFVNICQSFWKIETWRLKKWKRIQKNDAKMKTISTDYVQITYWGNWYNFWEQPSKIGLKLTLNTNIIYIAQPKFSLALI